MLIPFAELKPSLWILISVIIYPISVKGKEHLFLAAFNSFEENSTEYKGVQTEDTLNANSTSYIVFFQYVDILLFKTLAKYERAKKHKNQEQNCEKSWLILN